MPRSAWPRPRISPPSPSAPRAASQSNKFGNLFDYNNRNWSIGPSVSETIFDAGLRTATVHQYTATYNADLAAYRQTVLTAFQQVEDYLAQVRILSNQLIIQSGCREDPPNSI